MTVKLSIWFTDPNVDPDRAEEDLAILGARIVEDNGFLGDLTYTTIEED